MKSYKILSTKGAVLDKCQLEAYLEKLASDHILKEKSDKNTYPIPRMLDNFEVITMVYNVLNEHIKLKIPIHPAGEWLLDNYYVIEETVKSIEKELTLKKYTNFLGIANGANYGFARIYVLATEIVSYTDSNIDGKLLTDLLKSYQEKKKLNMEEIWNIGIFLQIALIENIRNICERIYSAQLQKYKVENIIERLVENKSKDELKFNKLNEYRAKVKEYGEMKYPFIEYMSYKLRQFGKKAYPFLNVLEEQVNKMGVDISEVIRKEHFDIAVKKVSMGNSITSIKNIQRINFIDIFEEINQVDDILKQDPAGVYDKMDYKTKIYYRNKIKEISKKTKISEIYIAKKCLELSENKEGKKAHIGYYLIDKGYGKLIETLQNKKVNLVSNNKKIGLYIGIKIIITLIISIALGMYIYSQSRSIIYAVLTTILVYIPTEIILIQVFQNIINKITKPKLIPKIDVQNGVPEEDATFVVIPTILTSADKVNEMMHKLEVYYIANKSDNIYFALLGDVSSSDKKEEDFDEEVSKAGLEITKRLNEKYPDEKFPKFHFLYRFRQWNEKEECFLGWERKRGLLSQFNNYLLKNSKNEFRVNTIDLEKLPNIKYVITLDADTELVLNTGLELIGAMSHILNKPDIEDGIVKSGHGILQPRVGISLLAADKSKFAQIYSGSPGIDSYTNAISDIYQDNFEEGIFTGKGIYDLRAFSEVLKNQIPDNTVLSHDLLEGCYLRCGLASDIILMDGYPTSYMSFKTRLSRWTRGDWQISKWLFKNIKCKDGVKRKNPLGLVSKYKILNNLVKSIFLPLALLAIVFLSLINVFFNIKIWPVMTIAILSIIIPSIVEIFNRIIYRKEGESFQKTFHKGVTGVKASCIRGILELGTLPDKAFTLSNSIIKSIYRMCKSKKHLLEWMTAEEAEKNAKTDLISYYKNMWPNIVMGVFFLLLAYKNPAYLIFAILFFITPSVTMIISKKNEKHTAVSKLNENDKKYLLEIGQKTWQYFKDNLTEKSNYLPPDNYQEDRKEKIVYRTSPTNIGLGLLAVVASYDLKYENLEDTLVLLEKMLDTITKMQKWNGHLYNWYNIKTLEPLNPKYVSTVDSGNFVGYLYTLKQFLTSLPSKTLSQNADTKLGQKEDKLKNQHKVESHDEQSYMEKIQFMIKQIDALIENTNFKYLYSEENRIFSIGFNVEDNSLTPSYYDLLASEARQASLVAIAKKDIPAKHWYNLSRTLTILNRYKGLISWSGTAFEYLMPNINIPKYPGSLISESSEFAIMSGREYAEELSIPWGISEAAFNLRDLNNNYQYKAFGIPWLGLKRGLADEMVVSSYASILAVTDYPKEVTANLKVLEKEGMYDKYGFYESIDYTLSRLKNGEKNVVVKTYMAHHQGLILLSIDNLFNNNILQKRFMQNPEMKAVDILLEERMPENVIITKEQKEKVQRTKNVDYETYIVREYNKAYDNLNHINAISNDDYTVIVDQKGNGYSKFKDIAINRYKKTDDIEEGIFFFFKNIKTKRIWTSGQKNYLSQADKYSACFSPEMSKFVRLDGGIETTTKIFITPNSPVEIRRVELKNLGNTEETIEISSFIEPLLSSLEQDYSHKAFNNLFLSFEMVDNTIIAKRKARDEDKEDVYLAVNFYTENETVGELEFELDKEKFVGRQNMELPIAVENSVPLGRKIIMTTDPIIAMRRTIKINPSEKAELNLIMAVSNSKEEALELIRENTNNESILRNINLAKAKTEAESMYLGVRAKDIANYQNMLKYLIYQNPLKTLMYKKKIPEQAPTSELWKYGISGDLPILEIVIKDITDIEIVKDAIKAYEYFRVKNIKIDLVILNEEKKTYENYLYDEIQSVILDKGLNYMQNVKGGIFIISNIDNDSKKILEYRANLLIHANMGNIARQIRDFEEEYMDKEKSIADETKTEQIIEEPQERQALPAEELKYYNEYGGFSKDGSEYLIRVNKDERLPTVWSNIMANENFGTVVTEGMGGYTWYRNSRLNRLTAWNNNPITDIPSEVIYIEDMESKKIWSVGINPSPDNNDYYVTYGFGYSKYLHTSNGIFQELKVFIPQKENCKIQILHLENKLAKKKELKLIYYIKPVLDEDEIKSNGYINTEFNENNNLITVQNQAKEKDSRTIMYITSSEKITSYTGCKDTFIGNSTLENPEGIRKIELDRKNSLGKNEAIAIEIKVNLEAFERKDIVFLMGADVDFLSLQDTAYKYANVNNAINEYESTIRYWKNILSNIKVETPMESMNILLNGWLLYQTLCSRMLARSGYYQSGGAYGFRDQLQDCIGLKYISPEILKRQILKHSRHQFVEGDVEHWWHEENSRGIRTRFSDDLLWLPYMVAEYIKFTGDKSILKEETNYINGEILPEGVSERYDLHPPSNQKGSIYEHCIKAIEKSLVFGENGLPKIGSGDWNDGFSNVGPKGKGESVWLGFFLYMILDNFSKICKEVGEKLEKEEEEVDDSITEFSKELKQTNKKEENIMTAKTEKERAEKYKTIMEELRKHLNTNGWDGRWFKRAFMDDGNVLGSIQNEECRIDSIAQSWATISGAGDNDKKYISLNSLENHLVDKEAGIIKLLDPPFEKSKLEPGYIKAYIPGTRENGGQYTHGAIWAIIAEAILGFGDKAVEYFRMINPIEHSRTKDEANKYKVEPYVVAADIYGGNLAGRGGWTWYTGSSSWLYEAGIKYILGLNIEENILRIEPHIPANWNSYKIKYKYGDSIYNITVNNKILDNKEDIRIIINGKDMSKEENYVGNKKLQTNEILLNKNGEIFTVEVEI